MDNYTYNKESDLMPDGDYEAFIDKIERKTLPSGKEKLSIMFRIRNDIEGQAYGNKCIFEDIWKEKENPQYFNRRRINQLLGTQHLEDGTTFETINDVIDTLRGCNLIIHITSEFSDYKGEDVNKVAYYKSSNFKPKSIDELPKVETKPDEPLPF